MIVDESRVSSEYHFFIYYIYIYLSLISLISLKNIFKTKKDYSLFIKNKNVFRVLLYNNYTDDINSWSLNINTNKILQSQIAFNQVIPQAGIHQTQYVSGNKIR